MVSWGVCVPICVQLSFIGGVPSGLVKDGHRGSLLSAQNTECHLFLAWPGKVGTGKGAFFGYLAWRKWLALCAFQKNLTEKPKLGQVCDVFLRILQFCALYT